MYNNIMNLMNSLEERYYKDINDNTIMEDENEYGIILTIDSITVAMTGCAIAAGGVLDFGENQIPSILVDYNYLDMNKTSKRFIIAHELGHIVCQIEKFKQGNYKRTIEDEFEADEYAMEQVGLEVALEGLNSMKELLDYDKATVEELTRRIENLINKSMVTC